MMTEKGAITQRMDTVLDELKDEFAGLPIYDRRAFERKMDAVKMAGERSDRSSKLRALFNMFDQCGIPYERGRENAYYETLIRDSDIPSLPELEDKMVWALFARYEKYPSPAEYMQRLVDRLSSPQDPWQDDPLRLRILKQFLKYGDFSKSVGIGGRRTIADYVKQKRAALEKRAWESALPKGDFPEAASPKSDSPEVASPGNASAQKGVPDKKVSKKGTSGKAPTLEEILALVDDGVFYYLLTARKEDRKPGGKYGILKIADDLASGKFRAEGATKRSLYLFAMVYGMTYYSGIPGREDFKSETDIEKNLFQDYYSNNLMRYITAAYRGNISDFEVNPSGQGINYKNFAEVIYVYFIAGRHTSRDKMRLSSEMIDRVKTNQFKSGKKGLEVKENRTLIYQEIAGKGKAPLSSGIDIFAMEEGEFEQFICANYDCDTFDGSYTIAKGAKRGQKTDMSRGFMQQETEQATAARVYADLLKSIPATHRGQKYGLWYMDVDAFGKAGLETFRDRFPQVDQERFDEFLELLRAVSNFVKNLPEPSPQTVTRTSIITAYYYYYNAIHEMDEPDQWKNFGELYRSFARGVNERLEAAYYQPLSGKNVFDVLVVFSSYAYMNL